MFCDATNHKQRVPEPLLAVQLMRVDNPCRGEAKVVALCQVCYEYDLVKIKGQYYRCDICGGKHPFRDIWSMLGAA